MVHIGHELSQAQLVQLEMKSFKLGNLCVNDLSFRLLDSILRQCILFTSDIQDMSLKKKRITQTSSSSPVHQLLRQEQPDRGRLSKRGPEVAFLPDFCNQLNILDIWDGLPM